MADQTLLTVKDLTVSFPGQHKIQPVVSDLAFDLQASECLGIVGESGSGKSMTALAIMQLLPYAARVSQASKVIFHEHNLLECSELQMQSFRGLKIGMIFQDAMSAFNPVLTIAQQMDEVLKKLKYTYAQRQQRALQLLAEVGIKQVRRCYKAYPHELSGGQRQRAMIAMALCGKPELIIADEPTTALDVTIQAQVLDLLLELRDKQSLALLFITHDLAVVSQVADNVIVMQKGNVVERNVAKEFFLSPQHDYSKKLLAALPGEASRKTAFTEKPLAVNVKDLKVYFPGDRSWWRRQRDWIKAVDGVSFNIQQGETLALVGESGSGKTTVARSIIRLQAATQGEIIFTGRDLCQLASTQLRSVRKDIQIIFQDPFASLNPRRMVADSIIEGMAAQKIIIQRSAQLQRVDELLQRVGLDPACKWRYPHEFSGGEKQRICIARALALKPKLLILDEPTSALDVSIQKQVLDLLDDLQQQDNIAYLLITHNIAVVAYLAHRVAVMYQGKIVEQGGALELLKQPRHEYTRRLLSAVPRIHAMTKEQLDGRE